jgi:hypothetical protein
MTHRCSFCGKTSESVVKLVRGPSAHICNECVELCNEIVAEAWEEGLRMQRGAVRDWEAHGVRATPHPPGTLLGPLEVRHTPLSRTDVSESLRDRFRHRPYVRFYRTDVRNNIDRPIRVVWFDAFSWLDGRWIASNVRNKVLRTRDFIDWYGSDAMTPDGWLHPAGIASCHGNWHWTNTPEDVPTKWAYVAVDVHGNDYFAEAIVPAIGENQ